MNEESKNIETCLAENILAEVASVPTDPQFVSLVNESLDPLKQQALQQAGYAAYKEVVMYHQPYTFTSQVAQMKSNLILLLRRLWRFPFGRGTIRSLADMWQHYITRLQGNETYGIPSRLSQLTDLPSAPSLLSDRKISGVPEAADGMSLVHLLFDNSNITEFTDTNKWECVGKSFPRSVFQNVNKLHIGVTKIMQTLNPGSTFSIFFDGTIDNLQADDLEFVGVHTDSTYGYSYYCQVIARQINNEILSLPGLKRIYNTSSYGSSDAYGRPILGTLPNCKKLYVENLTDIRTSCSGWLGKGTGTQCLANAPELLELYTGISGDTNANNTSASYKFVIAPKLQKFVIGGVLTTRQDKGLFNTTSADLIEIRIGGAECSLDMRDWNPTTALSDNLQQFLQNFRSFIILRLANRKSTTALTLTLSAAVYNAVTGANSGWASLHSLAELGITDNDLTDLETELLPLKSATIYASWLDTFTGANGIHWDINKAN
jgi:hypothetical protein